MWRATAARTLRPGWVRGGGGEVAKGGGGEEERRRRGGGRREKREEKGRGPVPGDDCDYINDMSPD